MKISWRICLIYFTLFFMFLSCLTGTKAHKQGQTKETTTKFLLLPDPYIHFKLVDTPKLINNGFDLKWAISSNRNIVDQNITLFVNDSFIQKYNSTKYKRSNHAINSLMFNPNENLIRAPIDLNEGLNYILLIVDIEGALFYYYKTLRVKNSNYLIESNTILNKEIELPIYIKKHLIDNQIIKTDQKSISIQFEFPIKLFIAKESLSLKNIKFIANSTQSTNDTKLTTLSNKYVISRSFILPENKILKIDGNISLGKETIYLQTLFFKQDSSYKPNLFLLAIGPKVKGLKYTSKDAIDFSNLFHLQKSFSNRLYQNINIDTLLNENATVESVSSYFKLLNNRSAKGEFRANDVFILYISSHGYLNNKEYNFHLFNPKDSSNAEVPMSYNKDIKNNLSQLNCNKIVFFDACRTLQGKKGIKLPGNFLASLQGNLPGLKEPILYSSSSDNEYSYEFESLKNGVFTYELCRGVLSGLLTNKNLITINDLAGFVSDNVSSYVNKNLNGSYQTPKLINPLKTSIPLFVTSPR